MKKRILRPLPGMDLPFLILVLTLVGFGLVMLASASSAVALYRRGDAWAYLRPQLLYAALGLCGMWLASRLDYHIFHKLAWPLLGLSLILLAAVLFMPEYNGCKRWLVIPGFGTLQPSEIAKFAVVLVFSHIISLNHDRMHSFAGGVLPFGLMFELPVVVYMLARRGLVTYQKLAHSRKYVILVIAIIAAILTPPDAVSQCMLAIPMILLYEVAAQLARLVKPKKPAEA